MTMSEHKPRYSYSADGVRDGAIEEYVAFSVDQVRKGLPIKALEDLAQVLRVDRGAVAEVLGISMRTLQRKAGGHERLGPDASDRLARIRRILDLATHVLGEQEKAARWLTSKSRALRSDTPLQMLDTDLGAQRVQQELRQIEFGMPL
jgi:putative toxin-antitoxin system antitoxin component (TIGR02293 family)